MYQARQLGRYQLLDRVAFGGMAEVYRAKTSDTEGRLHLIAVKRILSHLCENDEFIQMLVDEAKVASLLEHDNIVRIYEFCCTAREYFIAMEYVDGKDVRSLLEKLRQMQAMLSEEDAVWIALEAARALHAAHTQRGRDGRPLRIVHRDVSPSNLLLSYHGEVKLCDFGIAKATLVTDRTKKGVVKGKVKYMSPEQAMGRKLDHRSDLFSLGILLYELLTLQAPFQAPTEIELIFVVRDAHKPSPRKLRPDLHPALEAILDRALARSRSARFQSGEEMAAALSVFLSEHYPNYRQSRFGHYMRSIFSKEIEHELRLLEQFVIEDGIGEDVGENLLADALGPDATYTRFTAAFPESDTARSAACAGPGRESTTVPMPLLQEPGMALDRPVRVFISCADEDTAFENRLRTHLEVLRRCDRVEVWSQVDFPAGMERRTAAENAASQADVAVLLISAAFLGATSIQEVDLPSLLSRHERGQLHLIPVLLKPCIWREHPRLTKLTHWTSDSKALTVLPDPEQDDVFERLAQEIASWYP